MFSSHGHPSPRPPSWVTSSNADSKVKDYVEAYVAYLRNENSAHTRRIRPHLLDVSEEELVEKTRTEMRKIREKYSSLMHREDLYWMATINHLIDDVLRHFSYESEQTKLRDLIVIPHEGCILMYVILPDGLVVVGSSNVAHSSMAGGGPVRAAGELHFRDRVLVQINNGSGHYQCPFATLAAAKSCICNQLPSDISVSPDLQLWDEAGHG